MRRLVGGLAAGVALLVAVPITLALIYIVPWDRITCSTPDEEPALLREFLHEAALATPPRSTESNAPELQKTYRYCDDVGVDHMNPAHISVRLADFLTTGSWPSAALRLRYDAVAASSGWAYVRQADIGGDGCGFPLIEDGRLSCMGNAVLYCKQTLGRIAWLLVSDTSWPTAPPTQRTPVLIRLEARWSDHSC